MEQDELIPGELKSISDLALETSKYLVDPVPSIKTDYWPYFDTFLGGLRAREFTILCGSTGSGKTAFLANWSYHLSKQKIKHVVFSVETGRHDFIARMLSVAANEDVNTGDPISKEKMKEIWDKHGDTFLNCHTMFSLYDNRLSVDQLIADLRYAKEQKGAQIAFIDNLNFFMEVTTSQNQIIEMDRVIHELIIFCKQVDMHLVMVMHPKKNQGSNQSTRVESEYDIKGSSTAVQESHNVLLFNRCTPESILTKIRTHSHREIKFAKMRRRGKYVGNSILFDGTKPKYEEKGLV